MGRFFDASLFSNKTALEAALLMALTLGAIAVLHQIHHVPAANSAQAITIPAGPNLAPSSESSAPTEDSLNSAAGPAARNSQTSLSVNGQNIPIPQNGQVNQTLTDGTTTTTVNASSSNSSTSTNGRAGNTNSSSVNVNVRSHSSTDNGGSP